MSDDHLAVWEAWDALLDSLTFPIRDYAEIRPQLLALQKAIERDLGKPHDYLIGECDRLTKALRRIARAHAPAEHLQEIARAALDPGERNEGGDVAK